jgi:hypothetical protein
MSEINIHREKTNVLLLNGLFKISSSILFVHRVKISLFLNRSEVKFRYENIILTNNMSLAWVIMSFFEQTHSSSQLWEYVYVSVSLFYVGGIIV